jgi:hypothetical protein
MQKQFACIWLFGFSMCKLNFLMQNAVPRTVFAINSVLHDATYGHVPVIKRNITLSTCPGNVSDAIESTVL